MHQVIPFPLKAGVRLRVKHKDDICRNDAGELVSLPFEGDLGPILPALLDGDFLVDGRVQKLAGGGIPDLGERGREGGREGESETFKLYV